MHRNLPPLLAIGCLACLLAACGSGGGDGSSGEAPQVAAAKGTVTVRVLDESGQPAPQAWARVEDSRGANWQSSVTDAGDVVVRDIIAGPARVIAGADGLYDSAPVTVQVAADRDSRLDLKLQRRNAATTALLGARAVGRSADGTRLVLEADIAVIDAAGQPVLGLTAADFSMPQWYCGFDAGWWCIRGPNGTDAGRWQPTTGQPDSFELVAAPPSHDFAAGLLIDQGERIAESRVDPARVQGLAEFLESLVGANSIALAEYSTKPGEPTLRSHGGFVSDGRALLPGISGLDQRVGGSSPTVQASTLMLDFMRSQAPVQPPALVVIGAGSEFDETATSSDVDAMIRSAATPITTIGFGDLYAAVTAAQVAQGTGGASVNVTFPAQYLTALRGLEQLLSGGMPFYRMRFTVEVSPAGIAAPGSTLYTSVSVAVTARDVLRVMIVLPLQ